MGHKPNDMTLGNYSWSHTVNITSSATASSGVYIRTAQPLTGHQAMSPEGHSTPENNNHGISRETSIGVN